MNKRLAKARRILEAQREIDRHADWMLIDLERQQLAIDDRRHRLIGFIETESAFHGFFAGAMMRRLEALENSSAALRDEVRAHKENRLAERARMRGAQAIVEALEADQRRREEHLQLMEAIEASLGRAASASSKLMGSS